jgi:hypothetical protein
MSICTGFVIRLTSTSTYLLTRLNLPGFNWLSLSLSLTLALTLTLTSQSEPGSLLTLSGTGERNPAGACIRIRSSWAFWAAAEANAPDELPAEGHFRRPSSFRLRFFFWDWDGLHCTLLLFDVDSSDADTDNLIWIMYSVCTVNV